MNSLGIRRVAVLLRECESENGNRMRVIVLGGSERERERANNSLGIFSYDSLITDMQ